MYRTGNQVEGFRRRRCALVEPITSNNIVGNLSVSPLLHFTLAKVSIIFRRRHSLINIGIKTIFYDHHHQHKRQCVGGAEGGGAHKFVSRSWMVDVFWCHLENVALITFLFLWRRPLGRKVLLGISSLMNTAMPSTKCQGMVYREGIKLFPFVSGGGAMMMESFFSA